MQNMDTKFINWAGRHAVPFAKFALFFVYFVFGGIKVFFENGAANPLVVALLGKTMPFFPPGLFLTLFGCFEMLIGLLFIIPKMERPAIILLAIHMVTTIMPLVLLPAFTWNGFIPTLEGQYIFKNILIIALGIVIAASLKPRQPTQNV
jgi:uncharacterized membrane protein YphA (DoxX/SURF4 family)